jgi:addiction module RelE/StbE family toxin
MRITTHKKFDTAFKKLQPKIQTKFYQQLVLFQQNKTDKQLNNHALTGKYLGYRSFDVTGDVRTIFEEIDKETIMLANIGTHSQLYG